MKPILCLKNKRFFSIIFIMLGGVFSGLLLFNSDFSEIIDLRSRERRLIRAIETRNQGVLFSKSFINDQNEYTAREVEMKRRITRMVLEKYVRGELRDYADFEKSAVSLCLRLSSSRVHGGFGVGDSEEGFELLQNAMERYLNQFPEVQRQHSRFVLRRLKDGTVLVGMEFSR